MDQAMMLPWEKHELWYKDETRGENYSQRVHWFFDIGIDRYMNSLTTRNGWRTVYYIKKVDQWTMKL